MKKSVKKYQPGGLVDSDGNPVRDGSGNPIMTGSFPDEDEITARGRAQNAAMFKSLFNRATGRGKEAAAATDSAGPAAGTSSLRDPQQMAASKVSDGDVSEYDRRREADASAPSRVPTRPGQSSSGRKPSTAPKIDAPVSQETKTASEYNNATDAMRNRSRMAANPANKKSSTTDALRAKSRREAAFAGAKRMANTPEAQAKRKAMEKGQALERVTPELALTGAGGLGLKAMHSAAKRLAGTGSQTATKTATTSAKSPLRQKTEELIREDKNPGRSVSPASASPKGSLKDKTKELIQSDRTAKSNEMSKQMAEKQTPTRFTSKKSTSAAKKPVASKRTKKFNEDESGMDFKRGGSVSSRADGIAQRGKTRCKVY